MTENIFILAVDDDQSVRDLLQELLGQKGYTVKTVASAFQARGALSQRIPDLLIMDRGLPDVEGVDFVKEIRLRAGCENLPVLMLTARGALRDKVHGLTSGADDYLTKPFAAQELAARVEVLLKRSRRPVVQAQTLQAHGLTVDLAKHEVLVDRRKIELSPKEFELLAAFMEKSGHVLSRRFLMERVWGVGPDLDMNTRTVDVTVSRLRTALGAWGGKYINSVQNYGYRLEPES
ncbi:MAG: response regulator transcription factor [Elusimicrobiota bacterium]|jgi:DNA-binding response OmpR family regulator